MKSIIVAFFLIILCTDKINVSGKFIVTLNGSIQKPIKEMFLREQEGTNNGKDVILQPLENYVTVYKFYSSILANKQFKDTREKIKLLQNMRFIRNILLSYTDHIISQYN